MTRVEIERKFVDRKGEGADLIASLMVRGSGMLLTGTSGDVAVPPAHREAVAFLNDGRLLVSQDDILSDYVQKLWERLLTRKLVVREIWYVPPSVLGELYAAYELRISQSGGTLAQESDVQRKFESILREAVSLRASDIHITVQRFDTMVQFRIDGSMERYSSESRLVGQLMFRSIFYLCDESEGGTLRTSGYQDARISGGKLVLPEGVGSLRLQFNHEANKGHYLVIRIQYSESQVEGTDVDHLGYTRFHIDLIREFRSRPYGLNLVAGVTGSGKSTTLQRILRSLMEERAGQVNLITIEDPPELPVPGGHQFPVIGRGDDRSAGFADAIRAALRSDPDVLMVGEIRDRVTALLGIECTNTGHQVWTTVHAISGLRSVVRLHQIGVPRHDLLDPGVLSSLIAQRLVPRICSQCSLPLGEAIDRDLLDHRPAFADRLLAFLEPLDHDFCLSQIRVRNPTMGPKCPAAPKSCRMGISGRALVAEVVGVDAGLVEVLSTDPDGIAVLPAQEYWIKEMHGVRMMEHGFMRLLGGQVDPVTLNDAVGFMSIDADRLLHLQSLSEDEGMIAS